MANSNHAHSGNGAKGIKPRRKFGMAGRRRTMMLLVPTQMGAARMLSTRFDEALAYAHQLHRIQTRKGTSIPYVSHLLAVAALVIEHGGDENQAIAALLHDAVEDQGGEPRRDEIVMRFGTDVAAIVTDCTDAWTDPKPPYRERKEAYLAKLDQKPARSLLVSLADKTHNAEAILFDYRQMGDALWNRFNGGPEGTKWYYRTLSGKFSHLQPGRLADRLALAVREFAPE